MTSRSHRIAHPAGPEHQVVTVATPARSLYRREPCPECPWRLDAPVGAFHAEAFRISANTAYDLSTHRFACHMSGTEKPAACAGFLLRGADHNLSIRLAIASGEMGLGDVHSDVALYDSYREMAIANGVDENDPALTPCRSPRR